MPQTALVADTCTRCRDSACFRAARNELDALDASMGGIDELPPEAIRARERFGTCARAYSDDIVLRIEDARDRICACADRECVEHFVAAWPTDRADADAASGDDRAACDEARARAEECLAARTISEERYRVIADRAATEMCRCDSLACVGTVLDERRDALAGAVYVIPGDGGDEIAAIEQGTCACARSAADHDVAHMLSEMLGVRAQGQFSLQCELEP